MLHILLVCPLVLFTINVSLHLQSISIHIIGVPFIQPLIIAPFCCPLNTFFHLRLSMLTILQVCPLVFFTITIIWYLQSYIHSYYWCAF
jgi:hypothetical protein